MALLFTVYRQHNMKLLSLIFSRLILIVAVLPLMTVMSFLIVVILLMMPNGDRVLNRIINKLFQ